MRGHDLRHDGVCIVLWVDRISRRYDELLRTMHRLMDPGVRIECTLNGMALDGKVTDSNEKATRAAVPAFTAAQGEADHRNRAEMRRCGVAIAKEEGKCRGRSRAYDYAAIKAWRAEN